MPDTASPPQGPEQAAPPQPAPASPPNADETVKQTFESIILALILAFVFRAFVIEAFIIPTGSMAPTLLGAHVRVTDPSSGYVFTVEVPEWAREEVVPGQNGGQRTVLRDYVTVPNADNDALVVASPMTRYPIEIPKGTPVNAGDRILVNKLAYLVQTPSRWDVIVFKSPQVRPDPRTNFIKRLAGLPGESVHLFDGNVYVQRQGDDDFRIVRKTDPEANRRWQTIQRTVFQPVYHSRYVPLDYNDQSARPAGYGFTIPWRPSAGRWAPIVGPRYLLLEPGLDGGELTFDFSAIRAASAEVRYPYNQLKPASHVEPFEEIRLAASIKPEQPGAGLTLSTVSRVDAALPHQVRLVYAPDGQVSLLLVGPDGDIRQPAPPVQRRPLRTGRSTNIELWLVDHEALAWVDGELVLRWTYDVSLTESRRRPGAVTTPDIRLRVTGSPAIIHDVELDRDIYYSVQRDAIQAHGGIRRWGSDTASQPAVRLGPDQFFVLGDNTPLSDDGRYWSSVDPWVGDRYFHPRNGSRDYGEFAGIVPRQLIVGRAFFVYYPAPHYVLPNNSGPVPDFGRLRFIR